MQLNITAKVITTVCLKRDTGLLLRQHRLLVVAFLCPVTAEDPWVPGSSGPWVGPGSSGSTVYSVQPKLVCVCRSTNNLLSLVLATPAVAS